MKNNITKFAALFALLTSSIFTSCSSDDGGDATAHAITIELTEVGSGNNLKATAGEDLHLEAEILAPGKIASVAVEIHSETNSSAPEIIETFADYNGLLNATFHKHVDIPAAQPAGIYHLHLTVTDQQGNIKTVEAEIEILASSSLFNISLTEIGHGTEGNFHAHAGEEAHIEGTITSSNPIASITIEIHNESDSSVQEIEANYTNYAGQTNVNFHEHLMIPANQPAGDYHFHITVSDNQGNSKTAEYEFTIE